MEALNNALVDAFEPAGFIDTDDEIGEVKLLKSVFKSRNDVYGINGGLCVRHPLTGAVILRHLQGKHRLSIYPLLSDGKTSLAVVNIDQPDRSTAQAYLDAADAYDIPAYIEVSSSNGFHMWTFFNEPVTVAKVRELIERILRHANLPETTEIFPKQAELSTPEGVENCINLPLFGEDVRNGRTVFLSEEFEPYDDQWRFLSSIGKAMLEPSESIVKPKKIEIDTPSKKAIPEEAADKLADDEEPPKIAAENHKQVSSYEPPSEVHIEENEVSRESKRWHKVQNTDPDNTRAKRFSAAVSRRLARIQFSALSWPAAAVILLAALIVTNPILLRRISDLEAQLARVTESKMQDSKTTTQDPTDQRIQQTQTIKPKEIKQDLLQFSKDWPNQQPLSKVAVLSREIQSER